MSRLIAELLIQFRSAGSVGGVLVATRLKLMCLRGVHCEHGSCKLCPGEELTYQVTLSSTGPGLGLLGISQRQARPCFGCEEGHWFKAARSTKGAFFTGISILGMTSYGSAMGNSVATARLKYTEMLWTST